MIIRGNPTEGTLKHIYDTINHIIKDSSCYYTKEDIEKLKKDKNNLFIGGTNEKDS